jgi:hypothetical protein
VRVAELTTSGFIPRLPPEKRRLESWYSPHGAPSKRYAVSGAYNVADERDGSVTGA